MCIWGSNIRTIWSSSSTASSLFLYNIKIKKLQVEFCNSKVSFILVYQSSLLILLQQVSHIFSLWSCFEFAPMQLQCYCLSVEFYKNQISTLSTFFRWKIIRVYGAQYRDCVVSRTEINALIPEMWLREHFRFQTIKGGKFQKKLRCCVGVEYNKIIWFHQLGW